MSEISIYAPSLRGGGAERVLVRLANQFAEWGHSIDLVLVEKRGAYLSDVSQSVNIVNLDTRRYFAAVPKLARYLRLTKPDAILSTIDSANVATISAAKLSGIDTRVVIRISNMMTAKEEMLNHPKHKIVHATAKLTYQYADHVIGVSREVTEDVVSYFSVPQDRATTIYNPVVSEKLYSQCEQTVDHRWYGPTNDHPVVLGVGELSTQKDFSTLIESFASVDVEPEAKLVILGEGEKKENLKQAAKHLDINDRVDFPGFVDNPYSYMEGCDAFVLSSKWEGCPNVLIEAMACGAPLIATDCRSGPQEILDNGKYGTLVPVGDSTQMAAAITDTLETDHDTESLLRRSGSFEVSTIAKEYLQILTDNKSLDGQ